MGAEEEEAPFRNGFLTFPSSPYHLREHYDTVYNSVACARPQKVLPLPLPAQDLNSGADDYILTLPQGTAVDRSSPRWPAHEAKASKSAEQSANAGIVRYFKVPVDQRRVNEDVYTPFLFPFGPYHDRSHVELAQVPCVGRQKVKFAEGQHLKEMVGTTLFGRDALQNTAAFITTEHPNFRNLFVQIEDQSSSFLSPNLKRQGDLNLASHLALDGMILVAPMLKAEEARALLSYPVVQLVLLDSMLLENQIPIFLLDYALQRLADKGSCYTTGAMPRLDEVLFWYCQWMAPFPDLHCQSDQIPIKKQEPLLSYIYDCLTQGASTDEEDNENHLGGACSIMKRPSLPTASYLAHCGIRFKPSHGAGFCGIRFDKRSMELTLPVIVVGVPALRFLHNLIAYEATSRYPRQYSVISYIYLMDRLIDTKEDVDVLVNACVLHNALGSHKELATCWNKLCVSVCHSATRNDQEIMEQVSAVANRRWNKWKAAFKETYWEKQPWLLVSIVTAVILLVLTFLQTIYTMK